MSDCDTCVFYDWDEDAEEYMCSADIEEDDYARMMQEEMGHHERCAYWQGNDEYAVVAHQAFAQGPNPDEADARRKAAYRYTKKKPDPEFLSGKARPEKQQI